MCGCRRSADWACISWDDSPDDRSVDPYDWLVSVWNLLQNRDEGNNGTAQMIVRLQNYKLFGVKSFKRAQYSEFSCAGRVIPCRRLGLVLLEAVPAVHRASLCRLEGHFALCAAIRADSFEKLSGLIPVSVCSVSAGSVSVGHFYSSII
jgi:hypothetical protein